MEILIITQDFPPEKGGIQTYVAELAVRFIAKGHAVHVICPGSRTDAPPLPGLKGLCRIPIHSSWLFLPLIWELPRYLRDNPGITHILFAQWQPAVLFPGLFKLKDARIRTYCLVHGRELLTSVLGPLAPLLMQRVFARVTAAIPNSQAVLDILKAKAKPRCRIKVVHPGVDPGRYRPMDASHLRARYGLGNAPIVLCITRMVARKNLEALISAMPAITREIPDTRLLLGGGGPQKPALEALVRELSLEGTVKFLGRIPDEEIVPHFCLADIFAMPSLSHGRDIEGFGIVFLEAGACEVPVLGSTSGGIPDAVVEGVTGRLVDPKDVDAIAKVLVAMLKDPAGSKAMGIAARKHILSNRTWENTAEEILAVMEA